MRVAQINVTATLSTGRIAVGISQVLKERGHKSLIAFARGYPPPGGIPWVRVGNQANVFVHAVLARITDRSGFFSRHATRRLVKALKAYRPDVVHLHNIHGYYLHLPTLFAYLRSQGMPVVWTLHDCWAYTGHCAYYTMAKGDASRTEGRTHRSRTTRGCDRWKNGCGDCPQKFAYPQSLLLDQSRRNWLEKRRLMGTLRDVTLITPSYWLKNEVQKSFLRDYPVRVIPNGVDLTQFRPCEDAEYLADVIKKYELGEPGRRRMVLGVASVWERRKGYWDFAELSTLLEEDYLIVLVGLSEWQMERLPKNILGIARTENVRELSALYTAADVHVNLSYEETMGMTLIEAMACGTQVICYGTTALPESVTPEVGSVVTLGHVQAVADEVRRLCEAPKSAAACKARAALYEQRIRYAEYVEVYEAAAGHWGE